MARKNLNVGDLVIYRDVAANQSWAKVVGEGKHKGRPILLLDDGHWCYRSKVLHAEPPGTQAKLAVSAGVRSDDQRAVAQFDATPYFEQADDDDLWELARKGWSGCKQADWVAEYMADLDKHVRSVFDYLASHPTMPGSRETQGFECSVDDDDARAWVKANRPALFRRLVEEGLADEE
jgi:hypothetical protein